MGTSSSMSFNATDPIILSKYFGGTPIPGLLISNISCVIFTPFGIFAFETILLLANLTASRSQSNSTLDSLPLEICEIFSSLTNCLNPSVFKESQ